MVWKLILKLDIHLLGYGKLTFSVFGFLTFLSVIYSQPLDFPCVIKPRSRYFAELIHSCSGLDLVE